jgi:hypothetical protein
MGIIAKSLAPFDVEAICIAWSYKWLALPYG